MADPALGTLSPALARAILTAPVPAPLRALFARLPPGGEVDASLPGHLDHLPLAARQLVKLATLGGALRLAHVSVVAPGEPLRISLKRGARRLDLTLAELSSDLRSVCACIVESLYEPSSLGVALEAFAIESAALSTRSTLIRQMLRAPDLDHALYAMLSGVTSGFGLAFHRAALFVLDPATGNFVGSKAIGPADEEEAHRIWEEMEFEDRELPEIVEDYALGRVDSRFETFVRRVSLQAGDATGDEIAASLASDEPRLFERGEPVNGSLAPLRAASGFVLASTGTRAGERAQALLFADDAWSTQSIAPERVARLAELLDQLGLVWENLALLARIEKLARVDALTGVPNRRVFEERLRDEQSRARRGATPLTVLMLDLDRFKEINDTRGHAAGDETLVRLATTLSGALREHDTVARVGGDEFAIILPGISRQEALGVAARLGGLARGEGISVSIGGATTPDDTSDPARILEMADANLYSAKRDGRGRARMGAGLDAEFGVGVS